MFAPNIPSLGAPLPTLATARHSQIRQEADYIQERIIAAKALCGKLKSEIKKAETRLGKAREDDSSKEPVISLKKSIRKHRSRLNKCARNQQVLEERLEAIITEIQRLEQLQWRRSAPRLCTPQTIYAGQIPNATYEPLWSTNPHPLTPALCPPPMLPLHMQSPYHPVVGYLPRAPILRPEQVPRLASTHPNQQIIPAFGTMGIDPTDVVSPYDLNAPGGFPTARLRHIDLADAVDNMRISRVEPSATQLHRTDLYLHPSVLDHQSDVIRLQKGAKRENH